MTTESFGKGEGWKRLSSFHLKCWATLGTVSKLVVKNGKTHETVWSSLGRRYGTMKKARTGMPNKQMRFLRKTGSTKIKSDKRFLTLDSLYLGHSFATIADKHYNAFDGELYEPLDEAIEWLGSEFRIA